MNSTGYYFFLFCKFNCHFTLVHENIVPTNHLRYRCQKHCPLQSCIDWQVGSLHLFSTNKISVFAIDGSFFSMISFNDEICFCFCFCFCFFYFKTYQYSQFAERWRSCKVIQSYTTESVSNRRVVHNQMFKFRRRNLRRKWLPLKP